MTRPTAIVSVAAQQDNLGDIEIRSVLLDWITSLSVDVQGFRGAMSDSYMEPFLAYPSIQWHRSQVGLQAALLSSALRGRPVHFFMAPGPQVFNSRITDTLKGVLNLGNGGLARITGGDTHIVGRAFRGSGISRVPIRALANLSATRAVRDPASLDALGRKLDVYPDLAFYPQRWSDQYKRYITFCIREAKGLEDDSFAAAIDAAKELNFEPIFLVQVKSDNAIANRMAAKLGVRVAKWDDHQCHAVQLRRVEEIYAQSAVVVSNRLHGLILGARAGAAPIPIPAEGDTKLLQTLGVCLNDSLSLEVGELSNTSKGRWRGFFEAACGETMRQRLRRNVDDARFSLTRLRRTLAARLAAC